MKTRQEIIDKAGDIVGPKFNASPAEQNIIEAKLDLIMWILEDTDLDEIYEALSIREAPKKELPAHKLEHGMMVYTNGKYRVLTDRFTGNISATLIFDYTFEIRVKKDHMFTVVDQNLEE